MHIGFLWRMWEDVTKKKPKKLGKRKLNIQ